MFVLTIYIFFFKLKQIETAMNEKNVNDSDSPQKIVKKINYQRILVIVVSVTILSVNVAF